MNEKQEYILLTRKELYDCVWETSVQKIWPKSFISLMWGSRKSVKEIIFQYHHADIGLKKNTGKRCPRYMSFPRKIPGERKSRYMQINAMVKQIYYFAIKLLYLGDLPD